MGILLLDNIGLRTKCVVANVHITIRFFKKTTPLDSLFYFKAACYIRQDVLVPIKIGRAKINCCLWQIQILSLS